MKAILATDKLLRFVFLKIIANLCLAWGKSEVFEPFKECLIALKENVLFSTFSFRTYPNSRFPDLPRMLLGIGCRRYFYPKKDLGSQFAG